MAKAVVPLAAAGPTVTFRVMPPAAAPASRVVCHYDLETDAMVKRLKVCLTMARLRTVDDISHDQAQQLVDDQQTKQGCNGPTC